MIKLVALARRTPGVEPHRFRAQLEARRPDPALRARGHVQSHVRPSGYRAGAPVVDAVVELWFDDAAPDWSAIDAPLLHTTGALLGPDVCDRSTLRVVLTREHLVKDAPLPRTTVKNVEIVHRRPDLPVDEFHRYWREHHGPLAATIAPVLRYVQSHAIDDPTTRRFDGIASTWFESTDAMRASARTDEYAATRADEANFLVEPLPFVITDEIVISEPPVLSHAARKDDR